jgi:uncharacterized protein (TIGR02246 family)
MATMTTTSADIRAEIRRANDGFESTYANGDAAGMAALYTENGILLPPGSEPIIGQQAIRNFWQAVMNMGVKTAKLETVDVEQHDDTAIERGKAILGSADGKVLDQCKYMVIWKRVNGQWKLYQDIWNSSTPAQ